MKNLKVTLYSSGVKIAKSNFCQVKELENSQSQVIMLENLQLATPIQTQSCKEGSLVVACSNKFGAILEIIELQIHSKGYWDLVNGENIQIIGLITSRWAEDQYDQNLIDILGLWDKGLEFDWRGENAPLQRRAAYLRAMAIWNGKPKSIPKGEIFIIEGKLARDWIDFYILLSEALMGKKGFFALGLDSLEDSLLESYDRNSPMHGSKIIINNSSNLRTKVGNLDFDKAIDFFKQFNFEVELV